MTALGTEINKSKWVYSLVKQLQWMLFIAQGDDSDRGL